MKEISNFQILLAALGAIASLVVIYQFSILHIDNKVADTVNQSYLHELEKIRLENSLIEKIASTNKIDIESLIAKNLKLTEEMDSKISFFGGRENNDINITFVIRKNKHLFEAYFLLKGYNVNLVNYRFYDGDFAGYLDNKIKVVFSYDLSAEEISLIFEDLKSLGVGEISCVRPVVWMNDRKNIEVYSMKENDKCDNNFERQITEKELEILINAKNEIVRGVKYEDSAAHFLRLDEFREILKESRMLKEMSFKDDLSRYGK